MKTTPELAAVRAHSALDAIDDALDRILAATDQIDTTDPDDDTDGQEPHHDDT